MKNVHRDLRISVCLLAIFSSTTWASSPDGRTPDDILWKTSNSFSMRSEETNPEVVLAREESRHIVVQFAYLPTDEQLMELEKNGIDVLRYLGNGAYFAKILEGGLREVKLSTIAITHAFEIDRNWKLHPDLASGDFPEYSRFPVPAFEGKMATANGVVDGESEVIALYVVFHKDVNLDREGSSVIHNYGGEIRSWIRSINGAVVWIPIDELHALAAEDAVQWIEPPLPPFGETNDSNRIITQADVVQTVPYNLDGTGINVLVYDGGRAISGHTDFGGRVTARDNSGTSYHATHVCGTVGGDGASSGGRYRGMAPGVIIESFGYEYDGSGMYLYTNPGDLESDYDLAINTYGAEISNNSIGTNTAHHGFPCEWEGDYGATSMLIDSIVAGSLGSPMRIIWANGNERSGACGSLYHTTAPPACAKNHITVGALNSNDDSMTDFSSWGPTDDGRIKPDISAPGCQSDGDGGVTSTAYTNSYSVKCGTSMAAPTVTGLSALLLQDYKALYPQQPLPRNSTLKVLLAHNAVDLGNPGPDYQFGYGSVRIQETIDFMRSGSFLEDFISQGEEKQVFVEIVDGVESLKVTIAWDDPAGAINTTPELVNDLDIVAVSPSGAVMHYPWTLDPANGAVPAVRTQPDRANNIEQVVVDNPEQGTWLIKVTGYAVASGPQLFSLAATPVLELCSPAGTVDFEETTYSCDTTAEISVIDCGLNQNDNEIETVIVEVSSTTQSFAEPVTLTETGKASTIFTGIVQLAGIAAPGSVQVNDGDILTVRYYDIDDGSGNPATVHADAEIDCRGPVVSDLTARSAGADTIVTYKTDEQSCGKIRYGMSCDELSYQVETECGRILHKASLIDLLEDEAYFYIIEAADEWGNIAIDDNGGQCYSFRTSYIVFREEFVEPVLNPSAWFVNGGTPSVDSVGVNEPSPPYSLRLNGGPTGDRVCTLPLNLLGAGDCQYSYWYEQTGGGESPDIGDDLVVSFESVDSTIELERHEPVDEGMETYVQVAGELSPDASHSEFRLCIANTSTSINLDDWFIDDVVISCRSFDCNGNGIEDECDINCGNPGGECDVPGCGMVEDCNSNGIPDACEADEDCQSNGIADICDIADGTSTDVNYNNVPDECEPDCNGNGIPDSWEVSSGYAPDCNGNVNPDDCDIAYGTSEDCNDNGEPDECEVRSSLEKVFAADGLLELGFGHDIAVSGTSAMISAPLDDDGGTDTGAAYAFELIDGSWQQTGKLKADDASQEANFGQSVSINGDVAIIGARRDNQAGEDAGAAYIFRKGANGWDQEAKLLAGDPGVGDYFGYSVAIDGDVAVVGAYLADAPRKNSGAVYVFRFDGSIWRQEMKINPRNVCSIERFGVRIAVRRDVLVIGAYKDNVSAFDSGAAYVYRYNGSDWVEEARLTPHNGGTNDYFGRGVSIYDDLIAVGAYGENNNAGSVYLFRYTGSVWFEEARLNAAEAVAGAAFGFDVSCDADKVAVGAHGTGTVYLYEKSDTGWDIQEVYGEASSVNNTAFGMCLDLNRDTLLIGSSWDNSYVHHGVAAVFVNLGGRDCNGNQVPDDCDIDSGTSNDCNSNGFPDECEIESGDVQDCNSNGAVDSCDIESGVSIDCDTNGVPDECQEDCNTNGIADDCELSSGAGHDCDNSGVLDTCEIADGLSADCNENLVPDNCEKTIVTNEITASDHAAGDKFGYDASVDGSVAIIGAPMVDDRGYDAGAAYVFRHIDGIWQEQVELYATDPSAGSHFGWSASVSGDVAIVGARRDSQIGEASGAAYVFRNGSSGWIQEAKLIGSDTAERDYFGYVVDVDGDTAIVGAYFADAVGKDSGAAYIFRYNGSQWIEEAKLVGSDVSSYDKFGVRVSIDGDVAIVGAYNDDPVGNDSGAAYIFRYNGNSWTEEKKLSTADKAMNDHFGRGVSVSGDLVVVGAYGESGDEGAAYVYRYDGLDWTRESKLTAYDGEFGDFYGFEVECEGDYIAINSLKAEKVYVYNYNGKQWNLHREFTVPEGSEDSGFGSPLDMSCSNLFIGANRDSSQSEEAGKVYAVNMFANDCNGNGVLDECDISDGVARDCNDNLVPDFCEDAQLGDYNGDCAINLTDFAVFAECNTQGPGAGPDPVLPVTSEECLSFFDFDGDGDVDLIDFARFQEVLAEGI